MLGWSHGDKWYQSPEVTATEQKGNQLRTKRGLGSNRGDTLTAGDCLKGESREDAWELTFTVCPNSASHWPNMDKTQQAWEDSCICFDPDQWESLILRLLYLFDMLPVFLSTAWFMTQKMFQTHLNCCCLLLRSQPALALMSHARPLSWEALSLPPWTWYPCFQSRRESQGVWGEQLRYTFKPYPKGLACLWTVLDNESVFESNWLGLFLNCRV